MNAYQAARSPVHRVPALRHRRRRALLAGAILAFTVAPAARAEFLVAAAASLREPVLAIRDQYLARHPGEELRLGFGASSVLGLQIRSGAPVAVFLSADDLIVDGLAAEGLVAPGDHFPLARNRIVVIALPDRGLSVEAPQDLVQPSVRRIALASPAVPLGRYAREWLARHGLGEAVDQRLVVTEHARATLTSVDLGHADLAIVYATDAAVARRAVVVYDIPEAEQPRIVYEAARISLGERQSEAERESARRFLAHLRGAEAGGILEAAGFTALHPETGPPGGAAEALP